jgi:Spy/CpxP family protein refolding chaperone
MFIPISLALLTLSAGMFLLAKTNKEDLGKFFRVISFFIIISSFLVMGLTIVRGFTRMILHKAHMQERMAYPEHRMHYKYFDHGYRNRGSYERMGRWNDEENRMPGEENERHEFERHEHFEHHEMNPEERLEKMTKRFSENLNLKPDQVNKLKEILKASLQKENEIRSQNNGDREQLGKLLKENRQGRIEAIKKILTPEQLKQFNEKHQEMEHHPA